MHNDVVNLKNHFHELRGKKELLLFANERFHHMLLAHIIGSLGQTVDSKSGILLLNLGTNRIYTCVSTPCQPAVQLRPHGLLYRAGERTYLAGLDFCNGVNGLKSRVFG